MGFISSLKRAEEGGLTVPSFPALVIKTGSPPVACCPLMPAIKVLVWSAPIRMVLASLAAPPLPMSILLSPVVRLLPASLPTTVFPLPVVLLLSALTPMAVLSPPAVFFPSAPLLPPPAAPTAVLPLPVVLLPSGALPARPSFVPRQRPCCSRRWCYPRAHQGQRPC